MSFKLKIRQICEKLLSNEMTVDNAGHYTGYDLKYILERYEDYLKLSAGSNDGKWNLRDGKSVEEINESMRKFYQSRLDQELEQEDYIIGFLDGTQCFNCGQYLKYVLTNNKLQLRNYLDYDSNKFVNHPANYVCPFNKPEIFKGKINVSDKLYFVNFINEILDAPEGEEYDNKYSLNTIAGRYAIGRYKLEHNVAYSQTGASIGIYLNKEKTSIIVGHDCHPAEYGSYESDEEYYEAISKPVYAGHEKVGEISLQVWRFEATDLTTINKNKAVIPKDYCELDVPHGTWLFENYSEINPKSVLAIENEFDCVSKFTFLD
jgi:hypothetical protein